LSTGCAMRPKVERLVARRRLPCGLLPEQAGGEKDDCGKRSQTAKHDQNLSLEDSVRSRTIIAAAELEVQVWDLADSASPYKMNRTQFMSTAAISFRRQLAGNARHNPLAAIGVVLVVIFVVFALFAPWIAQQDPAAIDLPARLDSPSAAHWFGTDELGRDILSRVIYGARISMLVGSCVVLASLALGLIIGSIAGYYGGAIDRFVNVVLMNAFLSFPGILLAIAFIAFRGPGIFNLVLALSLGGWVGYARLVRGQVLAAREREFVEAARALGASDRRIIVRHILPNIIQPVVVQAAIGMAGAILAEATMSFLGLGVPPPTASWGAMLNDGRAHLFDAPHLVLFPALAVMLAVLSFNFIGDALGDYLDPRSRIEAGL
jgi:peptide/nickel transport system permease protein